MRALTWNGRNLEFASAYRTPVAAGQSALVKVHLAGICSTDLQILKGYMGFTGVLGHEFVGRVVEGPPQLRGERVVGEINFACGRCDACARGLGRHCPQRAVMGIVNAEGAFAEYVALPATNLHRVPDGVADEEAVFTEPLAAAFEILEQVQVSHGDEILVLGDGKLGALCAQVMHLASAHVTVVGKHERNLRLIKQAGVRTIPLEGWRPKPFDTVIDATGSASGLELALSAVRPRGTLVLKSTLAGCHQVSLAPIVINEINVIGSRCGLFPPALDALREKRVFVTQMIDEVYSLQEGVAAFGRAAESGTGKILLRP